MNDGHETGAQPKRPTALGDLSDETTRDISGELNGLLADVYALYLKTKNFHWHMSGPHFRDYHLLLDEQGDQPFAMSDPIAERVRKIGRTTLRSVGHITRLQHVRDNNAEFVGPQDARRAERRQPSSYVGDARDPQHLQ